MKAAVVSRDVQAEAYLQQLELLASEVRTAMGAIALNRLSELEASVSQQEMMAACLKVMAKRAGEWVRDGADEALVERIRRSSAALRALNVEYEVLLRMAVRTTAMMAVLCRGQRGEMREERGRRLQHRTWSCVM